MTLIHDTVHADAYTGTWLEHPHHTGWVDKAVWDCIGDMHDRHYDTYQTEDGETHAITVIFVTDEVFTS